MKLATLRDGSRDGRLILVSRDLSRAIEVPDIARTLQAALDGWAVASPKLEAVSRRLNENPEFVAGGARAFTLDMAQLMAPLPRAYQWADGSAYLYHVELVRKARGAEMPPEFYQDPLMYQGGSDDFIGPTQDIEAADEAHGIDFEAEVAVVTGDVPMGIDAAAARGHILLVMLVNDVSLRNLIPAELAKGFGFFQAKPASSFTPVAVTPDELGAAWHDAKLHLPLQSALNGTPFGHPNAGADMNFDFGQLIAHAARTRNLRAGTIIGSGTVSNRDPAAGSSCLAERRMIETIQQGKPSTPFMKFGDRIRIEMLDEEGRSIFGAIDQKVVQVPEEQMKLYGYFRSSAAFRVRIALNLKNFSYEQVPVHLRRGDQSADSYRAINPQGLVPALADDGRLLTQSLAIIEYLEETRPIPPLLPPDPAGRARVRALALSVACDIHPLNNLRVLNYLKNPLKITAEQETAWYRHWIKTGFDAIESMLADAATGAFCHGGRPSLADVCLAPQVFNAKRCYSDDELRTWPRIGAVFGACMRLPAFDLAQPGKQPDAEA